MRSNSAVFNHSEQMIVRSADTNDVALNFTSPRSSRTGTLQPAGDPTNGQSGITFQTDSRYAFSTGFRIVGNVSSENTRGIFNNDNLPNTGIELFLNRIIGSTFNRITTPAPLSIDAGSMVGGNYWSQFAASGNPSASTPFTGVTHDSVNSTGRVTDRFPFQSEGLGRGNAVTVFEPFVSHVAAGTRRSVRWYAPGCVYVDLLLDGATALATDVPSTGYFVVTIPGGTAAGAHSVTVQCKNSGGTVTGSGASPSFTVTPSTLQLVAPGRDDVFNAGAQVLVAWKKAASIATVDIQLSTNGGATFTTLAPGLTGTFAHVTLPGAAAVQNAVVRVVSGAASDDIDGVMAIRGTSAGFTNLPVGRKLVMGGVERLEWSSPANSRVVSITANGQPVATNLPDRGNFDWIADDLGAGPVTLVLTYKDSTATTTLGTAPNSNAAMRYATTITFGPITPLIQPGTGQAIAATANSGLAVALTSLTTGVCTLSGTTANAIANGTCVIAANQAGNGTFAPAVQQTVSFTVAADPGRIVGISTRADVLTGDNVMIGGFIIGGSTPKTVVVRARGPSLGIAGELLNPVLTLVPSSGAPAMANDDWQSDPNAGALAASGFAPGDPNESALMVTLPPGAYTAIVGGAGGSIGVALVEVFELDHPEVPLSAISTRGLVQTGDNVMIGGFIIQGSTPQTVVVRARGPSLGVAGSLPTRRSPSCRARERRPSPTTTGRPIPTPPRSPRAALPRATRASRRCCSR